VSVAAGIFFVLSFEISTWADSLDLSVARRPGITVAQTWQRRNGWWRHIMPMHTARFAAGRGGVVAIGGDRWCGGDRWQSVVWWRSDTQI
jgi:hypothetical protein